MNMQNQLQKLADAVAAREGSPARERLLQLFDAGTFVEIDRLAADGDKPAEAAAGYGTVDGSPVYAFAQDPSVCNGAVGRAQAAKIRKIYELAAQNGAPVVGIFDSDGAKLGEGIDAMDAIAEILLASNNLSGVVPQIAVLAGPCIGSSSLIAANADVTVAVEGAAYSLNVGDDDAKAAVQADTVEDALLKARDLLNLLPSNNLASAALYEADAAAMPACEDIAGVVDAAGFECLQGAAKLSHAYAEATTAKLTVVTGRAYGPVYIAAAGKSAGADVVLAWPSAVISPLAPETAVHILWQDKLAAMTDPTKERPALAEEYAETACSPLAAAADGFVTDVIPPAETKAKLVAMMDMLSGKRVSRLPKKHSNLPL